MGRGSGGGGRGGGKAGGGGAGASQPRSAGGGAAPAPQPGRQSAQGASLETFAADAVAAARSVGPAGRFGEAKVFINHAWVAYKQRTGSTISLGRFKQQLILANRKRFLTLSRADMVEAMAPIDVRLSGAAYSGRRNPGRKAGGEPVANFINLHRS